MSEIAITEFAAVYTAIIVTAILIGVAVICARLK